MPALRKPADRAAGTAWSSGCTGSAASTSAPISKSRTPTRASGSVESDGSTLLNLRVGREWARVGVYLDLFNLLDSDDHDIDYYYASRLPGEPAEGSEDVHFHVFEPRSVRLAVRYAF